MHLGGIFRSKHRAFAAVFMGQLAETLARTAEAERSYPSFDEFFSQVVTPAQGRLRAYIARSLRRPSDAAEVYDMWQELSLRLRMIWERPSAAEMAASPFWVLGVLRNCLLESGRRPTSVLGPRPDGDAAAGPDRAADTTNPGTLLERQRAIAECHGRLAAEDRELVARIHGRRETLAEAARSLAVDEAALRSRWNEVVRQIGAALAAKGHDTAHLS